MFQKIKNHAHRRIRSKIDALWNAFWTGGISNPLEVIEQITFLLFLKRLDDLHTLEQNKSTRLKNRWSIACFPWERIP
jgi:type I restriction enzyme M protein